MSKLAEIIYHCLKTSELYEYQENTETGSRKTHSAAVPIKEAFYICCFGSTKYLPSHAFVIMPK